MPKNTGQIQSSKDFQQTDSNHITYISYSALCKGTTVQPYCIIKQVHFPTEVYQTQEQDINMYKEFSLAPANSSQIMIQRILISFEGSAQFNSFLVSSFNLAHFCSSVSSLRAFYLLSFCIPCFHCFCMFDCLASAWLLALCVSLIFILLLLSFLLSLDFSSLFFFLHGRPTYRFLCLTIGYSALYQAIQVHQVGKVKPMQHTFA